jgi:hypothetical protein
VYPNKRKDSRGRCYWANFFNPCSGTYPAANVICAASRISSDCRRHTRLGEDVVEVESGGGDGDAQVGSGFRHGAARQHARQHPRLGRCQADTRV